MKITGVKAEGRKNDESDFCVIDTTDVYYIDLFKPTRNSDKVPLIHTRMGKFYQLSTLEGFVVTLKEFGFTQLDNVNVVNIKNIQFVHETSFFTRAYFNENEYVTVSKPNLKKIEHIPKKNHLR